MNLTISNTPYNCTVTVKSSSHTQTFDLNLMSAPSASLDIDVEDGELEITVIPQMADYRSALSDMEIQNWRDKFAQKVGGALCSMLDSSLLRVGCTYRFSRLREQESLHFYGREYVFVSPDLLDLVPVAYAFFEGYRDGALCPCADAFATNRKEVVAAAKKLVLMDFGLHLILAYPIQMRRVKKLTSDKKVRNTLVKFSSMSETERQKILDKQEKFLSR